jgi:hypothetical protein
MANYTVVWVIEIEADSPRKAAEEALKTQLDFRSEAHTFNVAEETHGLDDMLEGEEFETIDLIMDP